MFALIALLTYTNSITGVNAIVNPYLLVYANTFARLPFTSRAVTAYRVLPVVATSVFTFKPAAFSSDIRAGSCWIPNLALASAAVRVLPVPRRYVSRKVVWLVTKHYFCYKSGICHTPMIS